MRCSVPTCCSARPSPAKPPDALVEALEELLVTPVCRHAA